jgi:hypothetical protein
VKPAAVIPFILWLSAAGMATARPWTNTQGRVIEAELVGTDGANVSLKLKDGSVASVPLASLSAPDQEFVRSQPKATATSVPVEKRTWPEAVQVPTAEIEKVALVRTGEKEFVYQSESFEFSSQAKLLPSLIKEVARTFEATKRLVEALPWGIECQPPGGMERYLSALYETRADYIAAGGPENSGGVYMTRDKTFRIPFESLGIRKLGESFTRDSDFSNDTLIHEITHQLMHDYLPFLPQWAVEGTAELTQMMPYKSGTFRVVSHEKGLREYLGGRSKLTSAKLPRFKELFRMTRTEWDRQSAAGASLLGEKSRQHELYQQSALLVYYFNFLDGEGPEQGRRWMRFCDAVKGEFGGWKDYQKDLADYQKEMEEFRKLPGVTTTDDGRIRYPSSLTPPAAPEPPGGKGLDYDPQIPLKHLGLLLDGRTEDAVEAEMARRFAEIGLKLGF